MIDPSLIEQHLQNMEEALANLKRYQGIPLEEYLKDLSLVWIAEKGLQVLIQNLLDIGAHILASEIKNDWDDYVDIIDKMGEHGIIPAEFAKQVREVAGLRNILVHEYLRVEVIKIHEFLNKRIEDFVKFMSHIQRYLSSKKS